MLSKLDLENKCQGRSRNQKTLTLETKKHATPKFENGSFNKLCEANANSIETICRPPPYMWVDIIEICQFGCSSATKIVQDDYFNVKYIQILVYLFTMRQPGGVI